MGDIANRFSDVFRDNVTLGVPSSGIHNPDKAAIRAIGAAIEDHDRPALMARRDVATILSAPEEMAGAPLPGYVAKASGEFVAVAGWGATDFLPVRPSTVVVRDGVQIAASSLAASMAFYGADKAFLGVNLDTGPVMEVRVGDVYPNARYVRLSNAATSNASIRLIENVFEVLDHDLAAAVGPFANLAAMVTNGYLDKVTGAETANNNYRRTAHIAVTPATIIVRNAPLLSKDLAVAPLAFYDAAGTFLGSYSPRFRAERVRVGAIYPAAATVRASRHLSHAMDLRVAEPPAYATLPLLGGMIVDYFARDNLTVGYINTGDHQITAAAAWRTTPMIPVREGQKFLLTTLGAAGLATHVSLWDENEAWVRNLLVGPGNGVPIDGYEVTIPAGTGAAFARVSGTTGGALKLLGVDIQSAAPTAGPRDIGVFAPDQIYALQGEAIYLYARSIVADRSVPLAWNLSEANEDVCRITPADAADIPVKLRTRNEDGSVRELAAFPVKVTGTPVSPSSARNVIMLGDSITEGISVAGLQGAIPNELCRRLTGMGTALLAGGQSPAPLALGNIHFRGTRGDQPIKHEGRGGWRAIQYYTYAELGGVTNAFWNPAANSGGGGFDLDHYLTSNGFDAATTPGGVNADGSNLTIIIELGWNDLYRSDRTPVSTAADIGTLIDHIRASARGAQADIWVSGLSPGARTNIKPFSSGERYVSELEIFELAVRGFGSALKAMSATKAKVQYVPIAQSFCPEVGYATTTRALSGRSATTVGGASDHVHPNLVGDAMWADTLFYKFLYDYCR